MTWIWILLFDRLALKCRVYLDSLRDLLVSTPLPTEWCLMFAEWFRGRTRLELGLLIVLSAVSILLGFRRVPSFHRWVAGGLGVLSLVAALSMAAGFRISLTALQK